MANKLVRRYKNKSGKRVCCEQVPTTQRKQIHANAMSPSSPRNGQPIAPQKKRILLSTTTKGLVQ